MVMIYFNELKQLLENAYAPYSHYRVAALVVTCDNQLFKGVNVENASYGATICAERNAINNAVSNGYKKGDLKSLIIMVDTDEVAFPCFLCRQSISEFFDSNQELILLTSSGKEKKMLIKEIIPYPFTKEDLDL
jgi:cytidine deaminase